MDLDMNKVKRWQDEAIDDSSEYITTFIDLAKQLEIAIAITYLEKMIKGNLKYSNDNR